LEIKVLLCALVHMLYCVLVRSVRYCWSTWLSSGSDIVSFSAVYFQTF